MPAGLEDLFGQEHPGEPDEAAGEHRRALVIAAHPDDADFGAAGTALIQREILSAGGNSSTRDFLLPPASANIQALAAAGWTHVAIVDADDVMAATDAKADEVKADASDAEKSLKKHARRTKKDATEAIDAATPPTSAPAALPVAASAPVQGVRVGLRPTSPDTLPVVGWAPGLPRVFVATGHYRNGILLAPVTAGSVADLVEGKGSETVAATTPGRFERQRTN